MGERIDGVLFDWGHTLFDTGSSVAFLLDWAAGQGLRADPATVEATWRDAWVRSRTPEELAKGRDLSPELHRACWLALWDQLAAVLPGAPEVLYRHETSAAGWQPYPDTPGVLRELQELGVPVAVVSDVAFDLRPIFAHYGLDGLVAHYVLSGEHGTIKPQRRLFEIALDALGIGAERALMVGDNPANDGMAAVLGIRTLLLPVPPPGAPRGLDAATALVRHGRRAHVEPSGGTAG